VSARLRPKATVASAEWVVNSRVFKRNQYNQGRGSAARSASAHCPFGSDHWLERSPTKVRSAIESTAIRNTR